LEDHIQIKFTQVNDCHAEYDAEKKQVTITIAVWKIKTENINDQTSGSHQKRIGYYGIQQGRPKRVTIIHNQHNVQYSPNNPPAKKADAEFADAKR
jgi:hypothetical protein